MQISEKTNKTKVVFVGDLEEDNFLFTPKAWVKRIFLKFVGQAKMPSH